MNSKLHLDFETRSVAKIEETGAWHYAEHPSTRILCVAYAWGNDPVKIVTQEDLAGIYIEGFEELYKAAINPNVLFCAHNSFFEYAIWHNIMVPHFNMPEISIKRWRCTAAKAAACDLPRSLAQAAIQLQCSKNKDSEGHQVMMKLSKPRGGKWINKPELFDKLYQYCIQDVEVERELDIRLPDLSEQEQIVWFLDQKINATGICVDQKAVKTALKVAERLENQLTKELSELTDGRIDRVTRHAALKKYLNEQGLNIKSIDKTNVSELLKNGMISDRVRRILEIKQELGRSSLAKYAALDRSVCRDGRIRDYLMYHGAGTGRWAGKLVQLQNLPSRGLKSDGVEVAEHLHAGRSEELFKYPSISGALASAIRSMILPSPDRKLIVADYSAIEARVVLWLAGCTTGIDMFRRSDEGEDVEVYLRMAQMLYEDDSLTKEGNPDKRNLGKQIVLGCFAEDTLVITSGGIIPIQDVRPHHKLWDGYEWIAHDGVVDQGDKTTIDTLGVRSTIDHKILTDQGWKEIWQLHADTQLCQSAVQLGNSKLPDILKGQEEDFQDIERYVNAVEKLFQILTMYTPAKQQDAIPVQKKLRELLKISYWDMLMCCQIKHYESVGLIDILRLCPDVILKIAEHIHDTEGEVFKSPQHGKIDELFFWISKNCLDGMTLLEKSIVLTIIKATLSKIVGWFLKERTSVIRAEIDGWSIKKLNIQPPNSGINFVRDIDRLRQCTGNWIKDFLLKKSLPIKGFAKERTYDLLNAGPRNQYTILTNQGPMIVHNCGYGMGVNKFHVTCQSYRMDVSEALAERAVHFYRSKFPEVCRLWMAQENAAIYAVRKKARVKCGKVIWFVDGPWLICQLPSGRQMRYFQAQLKKLDKFGRVVTGISYVTRDSQKKQMLDKHLYGGLIVENICQATARDLMALAMVRVQRAGYDVLFTVHDEIIAEHKDPDVNEFCKLLTEPVSWAKGLPLMADGWVGTRYKKG